MRLAGLVVACARRHYWECVAWEDGAQYYDPLHTFHDWLAEERLRDAWIDAGLVSDGVAKGQTAAAVRASAARPRNQSAEATRWALRHEQLRRELDLLYKARQTRKKAQKPGKGSFAKSALDIIRDASESGPVRPKRAQHAAAQRERRDSPVPPRRRGGASRGGASRAQRGPTAADADD